MNIKMGLMVVVLLLIAGCGASPAAPTVTSTYEPSTATAESTTTTNNNANSSASTITYVDKRSGIAFDYPNGWTMVEPSADDAVIYSYSIASYDMTNKAGIGKDSASGVPPGQTKIDISFYGADETPDSARRTVQEDVDSGMALVTKAETRTAPDGSQAYYFEIQGRLGGSAKVIYTSINGHTVGVVSYGDGENFEDIVKSLRAA